MTDPSHFLRFDQAAVTGSNHLFELSVYLCTGKRCCMLHMTQLRGFQGLALGGSFSNRDCRGQPQRANTTSKRLVARCVGHAWPTQRSPSPSFSNSSNRLQKDE